MGLRWRPKKRYLEMEGGIGLTFARRRRVLYGFNKKRVTYIVVFIPHLSRRVWGFQDITRLSMEMFSKHQVYMDTSQTSTAPNEDLGPEGQCHFAIFLNWELGHYPAENCEHKLWQKLKSLKSVLS